MTKTTITPLPDPSGFSPDPLTDILRTGARRLIEQAVEAELAALLAAHADNKTEDGRSRVVRDGYLPEREVMTGLAMVFRLMMSAQAKWRKLDGANRLPELVQGIASKDGIKQLQAAA